MNGLHLVVIHVIGISINAWIWRTVSRRPYFCACDKITIGPKLPQCAGAVFLHILGLFLDQFAPGFGFYPVSLWVFILLFTGLFTYKSPREFCRWCIASFLSGLISCFASTLALNYVPALMLVSYFAMVTIAICLTALNM